MYRNSPKLMIRVDLVGDKDLKIHLILLDKYFSEQNLQHNLFIANDGYTIYRGNMFTLFKAGSLHLPKQFLISGNSHSDKISFASDKERYEYLKRLGKALVEWSNSRFWFGFTSDDRINLTFRNKVWVLF